MSRADSDRPRPRAAGSRGLAAARRARRRVRAHVGRRDARPRRARRAAPAGVGDAHGARLGAAPAPPAARAPGAGVRRRHDERPHRSADRRQQPRRPVHRWSALARAPARRRRRARQRPGRNGRPARATPARRARRLDRRRRPGRTGRRRPGRSQHRGTRRRGARRAPERLHASRPRPRRRSSARASSPRPASSSCARSCGCRCPASRARAPGDLVTRVTRDVGTMSESVRWALPEAIVASITVVLTLVAMLSNSALLSLPVDRAHVARAVPGAALPRAGAEGLPHRGRHLLPHQHDPHRDRRGRAHRRGPRADGPPAAPRRRRHRGVRPGRALHDDAAQPALRRHGRRVQPAPRARAAVRCHRVCPGLGHARPDHHRDPLHRGALGAVRHARAHRRPGAGRDRVDDASARHRHRAARPRGR